MRAYPALMCADKVYGWVASGPGNAANTQPLRLGGHVRVVTCTLVLKATEWPERLASCCVGKDPIRAADLRGNGTEDAAAAVTRHRGDAAAGDVPAGSEDGDHPFVEVLVPLAACLVPCLIWCSRAVTSIRLTALPATHQGE